VSGYFQSFKTFVNGLDPGWTGEPLLDRVVLSALFGAFLLAAVQFIAYRKGANIFSRLFQTLTAFPMGFLFVGAPLRLSDAAPTWTVLGGIVGGVVFQFSMYLSQAAVLKRVGANIREARRTGEFPNRYGFSIQKKRAHPNKLRP